MSQKLWGGRFGENGKPADSRFANLNRSLITDARLFADDIDASKAWAEALKRSGYLTGRDLEKILGGLELVRYDWIENLLQFQHTDEDVHTVNERRLFELIGETALRLNTGRSRNDQIVTDLKLWMQKAINELTLGLCFVMKTAIQQAELNLCVRMPGYTHMQRAQPILFSHWMLSHVFALREDCLRFSDLKKRANVLPLGSGAIAGVPLGIDRKYLAERLGFNAITQNSMHAVGDRDFVVDFIYSCSVVSLHLSRLAEDLILYATKEFDFVTIAAEYSTGSSLLPQKYNPDSLELVRGVSGSICAALVGIMMTVKGTPSTYNKDFQFDKKFCFEAFDLLQEALRVTDGVIGTLILKPHNMEAALTPDMLATDWAYYLVRKGIPFRQAHEIMGAVVMLGEKNNVELNEIPLEDLQQLCPLFDVDIVNVADYASTIEQYSSIGGTSTDSVVEQLVLLKQFLSELNN